MADRRRQVAQMQLVDVDGDQVMTTQGFARLLHLTLESEGSVYPARAWYPSSVGHPCDRYSVFRFTRWREQERVRPTLQAIFDMGNDLQPLIYDRLDQMGFGVVREYDRPMQYEPDPRRYPGVVISGRPDGKIISWRGTKYEPKRVLEAKSCAGWVYDSINSIADIQHHRSFRVRGYYYQGNLYAFLEDLPHGAIVLYSKATGEIKLIPFDLDYEAVERMLQKIQRLQPYIADRRDPEPIPYSSDICRGCDFGRVCYPAKSFGQGAKMLTEPDVLQLLQRWHDLRPHGKEYDRVDKTLKEWLKHMGVEFAVAGDFTVEGTKASDGSIRYDIVRLGE